MARRTAAVEQTRRRIIEAAMQCHAEQGIVATSLQDVARRADVALGTVYRHFPTLEDLVGACGEQFFALLGLPDREQSRARFRGARSRAERIERLLAEVTALYRPAAGAFLHVRDARRELQAAADGHERLEGAIDLLVDEALRPLRPSVAQRHAVRALLDARFWTTLLDHGLDADAAEALLAALIDRALLGDPAAAGSHPDLSSTRGRPPPAARRP
ncbi:MAG: TetR/AcrR family transcriptional regulator [Solirubrobacteraceae bacterium]